MNDLRKDIKLPVKGHYITAGYQVDEDSVKEMLTFMGVEASDEMVQQAIGFLSSNGMEINMNNLHSFLQSKQIMSSRKDLRLKKN